MHIWEMAFLIFITIEIFTMSLVTIWFAAGSAVAFIVQFLGYDIKIQVIAFVIGSLLTFLLFKPILKKHMESPKEKTNYDSLIGKKGEVVEEIKYLKVGQVRVNGQVWSASSESDDSIEVGSIVIIKDIQGVKLIVNKEREV